MQTGPQKTANNIRARWGVTQSGWILGLIEYVSSSYGMESARGWSDTELLE